MTQNPSLPRTRKTLIQSERPVRRDDDVMLSFFSQTETYLLQTLHSCFNECVKDEMRRKEGDGCFHLDGVHHTLLCV